MSRQSHLRNSEEFRIVYGRGSRHDGRLLSVFLLPNCLAHHRFGVTASKKATGNAVERNRSKRLMREAFRLSSGKLDALQNRYDWVLNARRAILQAKVGAVLEEFQRIVESVAGEERKEEAAGKP